MAGPSDHALLDAASASRWLATQPLPLTAPPPPHQGAWQRRLLEAAAWACLPCLRDLVEQMKQESPHTAPDLADPEAAIRLEASSAADPSTARKPPAGGTLAQIVARVNPTITARPLKPVLASQVLVLQLGIPPARLPDTCPPCMRQALENGVVAQALRVECAGLFEWPLNQPPQAFLRERFGAEHAWSREATAAHLAATLPAPAPGLSRRF